MDSRTESAPINIPMWLTWGRIAMIPLVIGLFYLPDHWLSPHAKNVAACVIFVLAALTDAFDGYIARRYGCQDWELLMQAVEMQKLIAATRKEQADQLVQAQRRREAAIQGIGDVDSLPPVRY
jgi:hypothetical protein